MGVGPVTPHKVDGPEDRGGVTPWVVSRPESESDWQKGKERRGTKDQSALLPFVDRGSRRVDGVSRVGPRP